jgi:hypothetical protein
VVEPLWRLASVCIGAGVPVCTACGVNLGAVVLCLCFMFNYQTNNMPCPFVRKSHRECVSLQLDILLYDISGAPVCELCQPSQAGAGGGEATMEVL